jgi:hypothetical protein
MLTYSTARNCFRARFEHSNFLKVNGPGPRMKERRRVAPSPPPHPFRRPHPSQRGGRGAGGRGRAGRCSPSSRRTGLASPRDPTTSFLTATTLIYAIGAGITAAAGTRLALQSLLVRGFEPCSFRLRGPCRDPHRYLLSLPPRVGIG